MIDDKSFSKILPGWNVEVDKMAKPLRQHMRQLALCKTLYHYGGMIVPNSFACFSDIIDIYTAGVS